MQSCYFSTEIEYLSSKMPCHYEKKEGTRRIMYRQDYIARAMIDVQDVDLVDVDIDVQDVDVD
ncbi:hypothetical protein Avbf_07561 [Armadillidium vulgare]|nr:hypothetical protein Avbf_07561 [Armadillidium vulgare]